MDQAASGIVSDLRADALRHEATGDVELAIEAALASLAAAPGDVHAKQLVAGLLALPHEPLASKHQSVLLALLTDPDVNPREIERAGWKMLAASDRIPRAESDREVAAGALERDVFVCALLSETEVTLAEIERPLRSVRRWMLLSGRSCKFPRLAAALVDQARHNGGAWSFDAEERVRLGQADAASFAAAYLPPLPVLSGSPAPCESPVTAEVAAQYDRWPYPVWQRAAAGTGQSFRKVVSALGPDAPQDMPEDAEVLVAGCATGKDPISLARRFPGLRITAIDISAGAIAFATVRRAESGVRNVDFRQLDIYNVTSLNKQFDFIVSSGVLHHLPDPELGWARLADVLRPGGVMRLMLYSKFARLPVQAARRNIEPLLSDATIDDDLLRAVRAYFLERPPCPITHSPDFYHLAGVRDMLLHRHEDLFDIPRVRDAIERLKLHLLGFVLPTAARRARYRVDNPDDPWFRDYDKWFQLEIREPYLFSQMYDFWCLKPG
ncbi:class I SAM-dependent methyltransferase [Sphingomonas sp. QA11]|uniref:class I SAM-dependent methyltransferase n=1 Tax=Sphingomonas sp. QA11 TaxID=2950605 RepID=UPI00234A54F8|nr:class I SAM-dependent methyltransferase [Sphingomonas sp. QA11]WCM27442.1 class I SAM-dependent methyltransferase [Sphingomonas sp. QA11]